MTAWFFPKMRTLAILSRKGGTGKTTLALHLAVAAEAAGFPTAILDLDPQASAALWSDRRGEPFPAVVPAQAPRLAHLLAEAKKQKAALVILDTPPETNATADAAISAADIVLIPCRPSALDLAAINTSIRITGEGGKPFFVVINAAPAQGRELAEMHQALDSARIAMAPVALHQRKAYSAGMQDGRTANEIDPRGKAASEIDALLVWLCSVTGLERGT